jgi:hypothetical protein
LLSVTPLLDYLSEVKGSLLAIAVVLLAAGCDREPELKLGSLPASVRAPAPSSLLRIPAGGGKPRLYRIPSLEASTWTAEDKLPPIERTVGADPEQGLVFTLDRKRNLVVLDLETRRARPYLEQVRGATVGPDGALYSVDTGSTVTQLVRRAPVRFRQKLQGSPAELHATMTGALLARVGEHAAVLEVLGSDQPPVSTPLPSDRIAASFYGDLVAVASDTGVVVYETQGKRPPTTIPVPGGKAEAVLFSPSGHRLYILPHHDQLLVVDRYSRTRLLEIDLPGQAKGLRGDRFGQWLLVQPLGGDSAWVVDIGRGRLRGVVPARWSRDLPAVASPNTLLVRRGKDVVAVDLGAEGFPETGRIEGGAEDTWLPLAWRPARDAEGDIRADSAALAAAADSGTGRPTVYLQVSSSQNPAWARELAQRLQAAGLPASVLPPARGDEAHRVVLGPYPTREQAEETGRRIGMPSFIVSAQDAPDR